MTNTTLQIWRVVQLLSAYYRESGYSVFAQLGNLLPLMLEIPFFIAAYKFLSTYEANMFRNDIKRTMNTFGICEYE